MPPANDAAAIRDVNDAFRRSFAGGRITVTAGIAEMPSDEVAAIFQKVRGFDAFNRDNDPHGEHDFGAIEHGGERFFWKIDLYEEPDVKNPKGEPIVTRVLTIMLAEEY